jgi:hypothetical protein
MRIRADLKGIQGHWCHFMLQPGANLWFKAHGCDSGHVFFEEGALRTLTQYFSELESVRIAQRRAQI